MSHVKLRKWPCPMSHVTTKMVCWMSLTCPSPMSILINAHVTVSNSKNSHVAVLDLVVRPEIFPVFNSVVRRPNLLEFPKPYILYRSALKEYSTLHFIITKQQM